MAHITFIHGIANKPAPDPLLKLWLRGLAQGGGLDLGTEGVTSSMVYWADVMYPEPLKEEAAQESLEAVDALGADPVDMSWREAEGAGGGDDALWMAQLAAKLQSSFVADEAVTSVTPGEPESAPPSPPGGLTQEAQERILLPWFIKERLMETLLRDVHHYLFNVQYSPRPGATFRVQDDIRRRFLDAVIAGSKQPGPHIVVSHSMGTVIAYDCLKRVPECPTVDGLMTIGCPLGLDEVQDKLQPGWSRKDGFPHEQVHGGWINVYDRLDPVAGFDPNLANDFRRNDEKIVRDINEQNSGRWRHNISKYFSGTKLRGALRELLRLQSDED
ncbi:MAG TPA: hypothetical protein VKM72_31065 [Thermoanaerobaculia bacterium]|nr:hypothetical protein [Thermoanaerobaculia bacterium]